MLLPKFVLVLAAIIGQVIVGDKVERDGISSLILSSTFDSISISAPYTGDQNNNATVDVQFKPAGTSVWRSGYPLVADRRSVISGQANPYGNQFRGSVVGLSAGAAYDVQVTMTDPDGTPKKQRVSGSISTLANSVPLGGDTWYVDDGVPNGDGSSGNPFNSIANALVVAGPNDTIHVRPGTHASFTINISGNATGWVSIIGEDRDTTFIDGGAITNNITVTGDFIQVKNLRLKRTQHNGVEISSNRHHVWLDNLYVEDISSTLTYEDAGVQIDAGTYNVYVLNSTILFSNATPSVPRYDSPGAGIHMNGAANTIGTFVFKGNTITGGFRDCIGNTGETFGYSTRNNTDIANNTISGCFDDGIQMEGDDINLRIWGNTITADQGYSGIAMESSIVGPIYVFRNLIKHTWTGGAGASFKVGIAVPTFYFHNTIEASGASHDLFSGNLSTGQVLRNNILSSNTAANPLYCMGSGGNSSYNYNLYFRNGGGNLISRWNCEVSNDYSTLAAFNTATGQEANGVSGNPLLIGASKTIDSTSPAYNVGVSLANFNDSNSAWPAVGAAPDIGYYEVQ